MFSNDDVHPSDVFRAGRILRNVRRLDIFIRFVERALKGDPDDARVRRLYGYACVVTNYDPDVGLRLLSDLYAAQKNDAYVLADYATALSHCNRSADAVKLFERGVRNRRYPRPVRAAVLDEYARYLDDRQDYEKAHALYDELLRIRRQDLHIQRRYAKSLHEAARQAHDERNHAKEEAFNRKAQQLLKTLLEAAPEDTWAVGLLENVERRLYPGR